MTKPIARDPIFLRASSTPRSSYCACGGTSPIKLSYRDLVEMMAERGLNLAHTTVLRWVQHYVPVFQKRWYRLRKGLGTSWRVDETYIKVRGEWVY